MRFKKANTKSIRRSRDSLIEALASLTVTYLGHIRGGKFESAASVRDLMARMEYSIKILDLSAV